MDSARNVEASPLCYPCILFAQFSLSSFCVESIHISTESKQLEARLISKFQRVDEFLTLFWKMKVCFADTTWVNVNFFFFFFFFFYTAEPRGAQWWKGDLYLPGMLTLLYPALPLSLCLCIHWHRRQTVTAKGSDTPGIPTLKSLRTHMWTNIHSALSLSRIATSIVTFNVSHIPKRAPTFHRTSKWQSSSPHSAHVSPTPPLRPACPPPPSLLATDLGSACNVSISHVSFLPSTTTLIQGQGLPSSHFPLPAGARVFWLTLPLISVKSDTGSRWSSHLVLASLFQHIHHQHIGVPAARGRAHTYTHTHTLRAQFDSNYLPSQCDE